MENNIYNIANNIKTKKDFLDFISTLINDYIDNKDSWENNNIITFLNGLRGYLHDSQNNNIDWKTIAQSFLAAKVYE